MRKAGPFLDYTAPLAVTGPPPKKKPLELLDIARGAVAFNLPARVDQRFGVSL